MIIKRIFLTVILIGFILAFGLSVLAQDPIKLLREGKYAEAIAIYEQILQENPNDEIALYNTACAYSLWNKKKEAVEYLQKAIEVGFVDFGHIESDPDLRNIRSQSGYRKLIRRKEEIAKEAADKKIEQLKQQYGDDYTYEIDEERKLIYVSKTSKELLDSIKKYLNKFADAARRYIFKNKPTYYITVLCLTQEDFTKAVPDPRVGGFYYHGNKTLMCRDTGGILRHEFTHALHYADLTARGQGISLWLMEGLATCFEESEFSSYRITSLYDYRIDQTKDIIKGENYVPWRSLMKLTPGQFAENAAICYAESRAIFYWLNRTRKLKAFYERHARHAKNDASGIKAMESLFRKKLEDIEERWKQWIAAAQPPKVLENKKGTFLGVRVEASVAGMIIIQVVDDSPADKSGLKVGDVILKIGTEKITSYEKFQNAIRKKSPRQRVTFYIIRGEKEMRLKVTLGRR